MNRQSHFEPMVSKKSWSLEILFLEMLTSSVMFWEVWSSHSFFDHQDHVFAFRTKMLTSWIAEYTFHCSNKCFQIRIQRGYWPLLIFFTHKLNLTRCLFLQIHPHELYCNVEVHESSIIQMFSKHTACEAVG